MLFKLGKFSFELALAVKALDYGKSKVGVWVPSSIPDRYGLVKKKFVSCLPDITLLFVG